MVEAVGNNQLLQSRLSCQLRIDPPAHAGSFALRRRHNRQQQAAFTTAGIWQTLTSPAGFEGSNNRARNPSTDGFASEIIVDNTDAGVSATGVWTSSTNLNGY